MSSSNPSSSLDPLVGKTLGDRYVVESKLGHGAMGTVYRAHHARLSRPVAVKVLRPELVEDPKVAARFTREAELAGTLSHKNLVGVVDVGESEGQLYMVMDLAEGPDLGDVIGSSAPMPPARVSSIAKQLCDGLDHAHDRGMVHRDFKPENVIVVDDGSGGELVKIVDFGIAILKDQIEGVGGAGGRLTTAGMVVGTPSYMAPEQALARPVDHRVDLYALGVILYEMISGVRPFAGTGVEIAHAHVIVAPPPISTRVPYLIVDPLLEALAMKLMAKSPAARPTSARDVKRLLELIESDRAAAADALGVHDAFAPDEAATTRVDANAVRAGVLPPLLVPSASVPSVVVSPSVEQIAYDVERKPWLKIVMITLVITIIGFALVYLLLR